MNIIFGLIIRGFGANREQQKENMIDITQKCFICGLKKYEFDMKGDGWLNHIYLEHNVYQYVFYIIYVKNKKLEECNLIEKKVKQDLKNNMVEFFPIGQATVLNHNQEIKEGEQKEDQKEQQKQDSEQEKNLGKNENSSKNGQVKKEKEK